MRIDPKLVQASVARARRSRFDPKAVSERLTNDAKPREASSIQQEGRLSQMLAESGDLGYARRSLERVIRGNDLVSVNYLAKGAMVSRSVCRIRLRSGAGDTVGFGTGFMVAPGVLMTNHHVIESASDAETALAEFDYEADLGGKPKVPVVFAVNVEPPPITNQALDFTLVAVAERNVDGTRSLSDFGWLPLNPVQGKAFVGEYLTIIQHPGGERKQVCVRENKLLKFDEEGSTIWYETDTVGGSSGSPVFNGMWQVVALHHSGVPKTDSKGRWLTVDGVLWNASMDESQVAWIANEGIRVSRIMDYLKDSSPNHPLAIAVLEQLAAPFSPVEASSRATPSDVPGNRLEDGELHVTIPVHVSVRVGDKAKRPTSLAPPIAIPSPAVRSAGATPSGASSATAGASGSAIESVDIDQSNYGARLGYQPNFLGTRIPFPKIKERTGLSLLRYRSGSGTSTELKYWTYSVAMCKQRRLAFVAVGNVNANERPTAGGRDGDRWYFDPRIRPSIELGPEFYGKQKTVEETDRSRNPFDRGHLIRRLDAQWGKSAALQKRNGDDSFHWSNCSPQHYKFNQGSKRWLGLEDYVITKFAAETGLATVFNGPIFDAPRSTLDDDGDVQLQLRGPSHRDPTFGGVAIPKLFFKIVVCRTSAKSLGAAAFIMSQEDFLATTSRVKGLGDLEALTNSEARLYQVRIADIQRLTGISFGLSKWEVGIADENAQFGARRVRILEDISLDAF